MEIPIYKNLNSLNNNYKIDYLDFANDKRFELSDPFLGAIVVFSDCSSDGTVFDSGHVSFVVGKSSDSKMYYCLGGNQNQMLKVSIYNCSGDIFKRLFRTKVELYSL